MKKRFVTLFLVMVFSVTGVVMESKNVYAEEDLTGYQDRKVSVSDIWSDNVLVGYTTMQTRGVYLIDGVSVINDAGGGIIAWGGITNASQKCKVTCTSIVERKEGGSWKRVTSSTTTNPSAYSAVVSKKLAVTSGYYYRVRSSHYAASDVSSSCTDGLKM